MALSDKRIYASVKDGSIVIDPFNPDYLNTSSYDVRLGKWHFREFSPARLAATSAWAPPSDMIGLFDIYNESDVKKVWGFPLTSDTTDGIILLEPGETILAHTEEFIGARYNKTSMMKARSSFGRCFIEVCKCAGWGDVGYINRWTMEITNNSRYYRIPLRSGRRIAQMVFFETGETWGKDYSVDGKYQTTELLEKLKSEWTPFTMLPRLYADKD